MQSVVNLMGKYCTRCGGGIFTAWKTLDNIKFYHPHCFTCASCGIIVLEEIPPEDMKNLKEIYCRRCFRHCFEGRSKTQVEQRQCGISNEPDREEGVDSGTNTNRQYFQYPVSTPVAGASGRSKSQVEQCQCCSKEPDREGTVNSRTNSNRQYFQFPVAGASNDFQYQARNPTVEASKDFQYQTRTPTTPSSFSGNQNERSDTRIIFSSGHHNYSDGNLSRISFTQDDPRSVAYVNDQICRSYLPPQSYRVPSQLNSNYVNGNGSYQRFREVASRIQHKEDNENIPKAFLEVMKTSSKNVRKVERSRSRIPVPTSSISRKSLTSGLAELTTASSKSKASLKIATNSRSTNNSRTNSILTNDSIAHKSLSMVHNKLSKSPGEVVGSGTKKSQTAKKVVRPRPRSAVEGKPSKTPQSGVKSSASKRHCAASFSKHDCLESNAYSKSQCELTRQRLACYVDSNHNYTTALYDNYNHDVEKPTTVVVPSPESILSEVGGECSANSSASLNDLSKGSKKKKSLSKITYHVTFDCPICISSLVPGSNDGVFKGRQVGKGNAVTACGHLFHRDCIDRWLKIKGNKRCPICSARCLPETLQPVYLECNVSADLESRSSVKDLQNAKTDKAPKNKTYDATFKALRSEFDLLKAKYNALLEEKEDYSMKITIANSLQHAYDMECRNRQNLQFENKKLMRQIEDLQRFRQ